MRKGLKVPTHFFLKFCPYSNVMVTHEDLVISIHRVLGFSTTEPSSRIRVITTCNFRIPIAFILNAFSIARVIRDYNSDRNKITSNVFECPTASLIYKGRSYQS